MERVTAQQAVPEQAVLTHVTVDMYGVDAGLLNDAERIGAALVGAAAAARLQPLSEPAVYRYPVQGLTVFLPIRESHVAMHTYPEFGYASADIVSCAVADRAKRARDYLVERLDADRFETQLLLRGFVSRHRAHQK